jgi:acyl carrier protein
MSIRRTIIDCMEDVAAKNGKILSPILTDKLPLAECGLDSVCFMILLLDLEGKLGIDPLGLTAPPDTLGEFVSVYENAAEPAAHLTRDNSTLRL